MKNRRLVSDISMLTLQFSVAIGMLLFALLPSSYNHFHLAFIFMLASLPHLVIFMLGKRFKDPLKITDFAFIIVSFIIGIIFLFVDDTTMHALVIIWGIADLIRALYHFFDSVIEFHHNKFELIEMVADIIEIIFATLIIFEGEEGIRLHLIMSFVALVIAGSKFTIDLVLRHQSKKHK